MDTNDVLKESYMQGVKYAIAEYTKTARLPFPNDRTRGSGYNRAFMRSSPLMPSVKDTNIPPKIELSPAPESFKQEKQLPRETKK